MIAALQKLLTGNIDASTAKGKLTLLLVVACLAYLFNWDDLFTRPYLDFKGTAQYRYTAQANPAIAAKIAQPFGSVDLGTDASRHFEKLAFRFVPFLIAHFLGIGHHGLACLEMLLGIMFPLLVWKLLFNATESISVSTAGVVLLNGLYVGCSFFCDQIFFDSFAYFFLLCAMLRVPRWASMVLMMCAAFTDERAALAGCLVPFWHLFAQPNPTVNDVKRELQWMLAFAASYVAIRIGIGFLTGLETGQHGIGFSILRLNLPNIVLLTWSVFEGGWVVVIFAMMRLWDSGNSTQRVMGILATGCFACIFLTGLLVGDSIRSQQYAFPLLLMAVVVACRAPNPIPRRIMGMAIILTLITPVSIYLGMRHIGSDTVYNLYPLRPGYLSFFGL